MISSRLSSQNNDELRASTFHVRSSGVGGGVNAGAFSFGWSDDIYENRSTSNNSASSSRTGSPTPGFVQSMPAAGGQQPIHNSGKALSTGVAAHMTKALPVDFVLGENDVICGRGSRCFNHIGNQRFRAIVDERLEEYMKTTCKHEKTTIIIDIVKIIRKNSPNGGFVKKDTESGLYYEVGDFLAVSSFCHLISRYI